MTSREKSQEMQQAILIVIGKGQRMGLRNITHCVRHYYGIWPPLTCYPNLVYRNLVRLVSAGQLIAEGRTSDRVYSRPVGKPTGNQNGLARKYISQRAHRILASCESM